MGLIDCRYTEIEGSKYLVMEFCPNYDIAIWQQSIDFLDLPMDGKLYHILRIARGIALALSHVHLNNVIHNDVALRNVMLSQDLTPKLGDFGLAVFADRQETLTGGVVLPVTHCAPERFNGICSFATDVFAYGVLLWELLFWESSWLKRQYISDVENEKRKILEVLRGIAFYNCSECDEFLGLST